MNNITCDVCKDLIPLVQDGVASKDSENLVKNHIKECEECKEYLSLFTNDIEKGIEKDINTEKVFTRFKKKIQKLSIIIVILGILVGISLTATENVLYNSIIMPTLGIIGYIICRWKAVYIIPIFMLIWNIPIIIIRIILDANVADITGILLYDVIYIVFIVIGVVIAGLLHYSCRKE